LGKALTVNGDVIAHAMTILPEREELVSFGAPAFASQIWLLARHDSSVNPIIPTDNVELDITDVGDCMQGMELLGIADTGLDPARS